LFLFYLLLSFLFFAAIVANGVPGLAAAVSLAPIGCSISSREITYRNGSLPNWTALLVVGDREETMPRARTGTRDLDEKARFFSAGGAGFVGSHLCARLLKENNDVLRAENHFTLARSNVEPGSFLNFGVCPFAQKGGTRRHLSL
jgi:hypothetical protein